MKIALFGTNFSENFNKYIQHLINKLEAENIKIYVEQFFYNYLEDRLQEIHLLYLLISLTQQLINILLKLMIKILLHLT